MIWFVTAEKVFEVRQTLFIHIKIIKELHRSIKLKLASTLQNKWQLIKHIYSI